MRQIEAIENTAQLMSIADDLHSAHEENLFYGTISGKTQQADDYKAIVNSNTGKIEMAARKNYTIIQNRHAVQAVFETLKSKGLEIEGRFDNFGGKIKLSCYFKDDGMPVVADDAKGVKLGFIMENSYNGGASFKLSMYGFRMLCQNGMNVGNVMNNITEVKRHVGTIEFQDLKTMTETFFQSVITSSKELERLIKVSINDVASFENISKILIENFDKKKHRNKIAEKLGITFIEVEEKGKEKKIVPIVEKEGKQSYTRWELYNAITDYATHDENISSNVSDWMQDGAQKILKNNFEELLTAKAV